MNANDGKIDAARLELLLGELRLPGVKLVWAKLAATADAEGWPAARFLASLAEQEMVERSRRRFVTLNKTGEPHGSIIQDVKGHVRSISI